MVNKNSHLYREHPDWILGDKGRRLSHGRNQYVLDFSRDEVVNAIFGQMYKVLSEAPISYVKWDMNRSMSEVYSTGVGSGDQGKVFHRYILGVYRLYDMLTKAFPKILFESCASGGGRLIRAFCIMRHSVGHRTIRMRWSAVRSSMGLHWSTR